MADIRTLFSAKELIFQRVVFSCVLSGPLVSLFILLLFGIVNDIGVIEISY